MEDAGLKAQLKFPLQLEALAAQGIILAIAIPFYLTRDYWYFLPAGGALPAGGTLPAGAPLPVGNAPDSGSANIWVALNWTGVTLFLTMLVEYGFAVIDSIVRGSPRIPVFSFAFLAREIGGELAEAIGNLGDVAGFKLVKQQLMVMSFLGLAWYLNSQALVLPGLLVTVLFIVVLPASIAINAMSGNMLALLDPVKLIRFAWQQGPSYWLCVMALLGGWASFRLALESSVIVFLLVMPVGLYWAVFMFKVLGDCLHARRDSYFPRVNFRADREALAKLSKSREFLDRRLQDILGLVRNRQIDQACRELEHFLASNNWQYFDLVFAAVSGWPDLRPAQRAVSGYLPVAVAARQYMQALTLCEWQLHQDRDFALHQAEDTLILADQAATPVQYRVAIRLLINSADKRAGQSQQEEKVLLEKAAFVAGNRLHDEKRLQEIMTRLRQS